MMTRHFLYIFLPALLFLMFIFFIRIVQYQPLNPVVETPTEADLTLEKNSSIPIFPEDPILGAKNAGQTIIVFGDFACEACQEEYTLLSQLLRDYPTRVKVIWKGLPIKTIPYNSETAQKHGFCVNKQNKFNTWIETAFAHSNSLDEETLLKLATNVGVNTSELTACLSAQATSDYIQKTKDLAEILNIQSVPTLFFKNAQISSPQSIDEWKTLLSL